jgi:hypothetical protein
MGIKYSTVVYGRFVHVAGVLASNPWTWELPHSA